MCKVLFGINCLCFRSFCTIIHDWVRSNTFIFIFNQLSMIYFYWTQHSQLPKTLKSLFSMFWFLLLTTIVWCPLYYSQFIFKFCLATWWTHWGGAFVHCKARKSHWCYPFNSFSIVVATKSKPIGDAREKCKAQFIVIKKGIQKLNFLHIILNNDKFKHELNRGWMLYPFLPIF